MSQVYIINLLHIEQVKERCDQFVVVMIQYTLKTFTFTGHDDQYIDTIFIETMLTFLQSPVNLTTLYV